MSETPGQVLQFVRSDPFAVLGLFLLGFSGVMTYHVHTLLEKIGPVRYNTIRNLIFLIPMTYVREGSKRGLSPWPAYVVWLAAVLGAVFLVLGLLRL